MNLSSDFPYLKESFLKEHNGKYGKYFILGIPVSEDISSNGFASLILDEDLFHDQDGHGVGVACKLTPSDVNGYYDLNYIDAQHGIFGEESVKISCKNDKADTLTGSYFSTCFIDCDKLAESYKNTNYFKGTVKKIDEIAIDKYKDTILAAEKISNKSLNNKDISDEIGQ